jgi:hypothetical protein
MPGGGLTGDSVAAEGPYGTIVAAVKVRGDRRTRRPAEDER